MCGVRVNVFNYNNTMINISAAKCALNNTTITVDYNGKTASINFTYNPNVTWPVINSLNISSASPVLKGSLRIYGTNFGTNKQDVTVFLTNLTTGDIVYPLNVLSINDTEILVKLSGGQTGKFKVSVGRLGFGFSDELSPGVANFNYEIVMTGVSPTSGSRSGGTVLTVTGRNFSPDLL